MYYYKEYIIPVQANIPFYHGVQSVCIRRFSGPHFPEFGLNTETYNKPYLSVFSSNAGKCGPEKFRIPALFT